MTDTNTPNPNVRTCVLYTRINGKLFSIAALVVTGDIEYMKYDIGRKLGDIAPGVIPPQYTNFVFTEIAHSAYLDTTFLIFQHEPSKPLSTPS